MDKKEELVALIKSRMKRQEGRALVSFGTLAEKLSGNKISKEFPARIEIVAKENNWSYRLLPDCHQVEFTGRNNGTPTAGSI